MSKVQSPLNKYIFIISKEIIFVLIIIDHVFRIYSKALHGRTQMDSEIDNLLHKFALSEQIKFFKTIS